MALGSSKTYNGKLKCLHPLLLTEREMDRLPKDCTRKLSLWDFPGGVVVKNLPANAGNTGLSTDPGRTRMPRSN